MISCTVNPPAPARETKSLVNCAEPARVFVAGALDFLVGDKCPGALLGLEDAANLHLAIGALDGVGVDGEVDSDLAHGGQLLLRL